MIIPLTMKQCKWKLILALLLLMACVHAKGGRGGSRGSSHSWGGRSRSSSSHHSSSSSRGNWLTNLFGGSKSSSSHSGSSSSSSSSGSGVPHNSYPKQPTHSNYPKQPAYNPSFTGTHSTSSHNTGRHPPPYESLYPKHASNSWSHQPNYGYQQPNNFGMFHPHNNVQQSVTTYHFIPTYHHYDHYHHHGPSHYRSYHTSTERPETYTTPAPITAPIVMDMDPPKTDESATVKPSLVVAVNNMVLYGDYKENSHFAVIIDEQYEDPGEIPAMFIARQEDEGPSDYFPPRPTTTTPSPLDIQISVQHHNATVLADSVPADTTTSTPISNVTDRIIPEKVLDMQFFSDVDGAN